MRILLVAVLSFAVVGCGESLPAETALTAPLDDFDLAAACADSHYSDCVEGLLSAMAGAPPGAFVAICDFNAGGEIVIVLSEDEAADDCAEGELVNVVRVPE